MQTATKTPSVVGDGQERGRRGWDRLGSAGITGSGTMLRKRGMLSNWRLNWSMKVLQCFGLIRNPRSATVFVNLVCATEDGQGEVSDPPQREQALGGVGSKGAGRTR